MFDTAHPHQAGTEILDPVPTREGRGPADQKEKADKMSKGPGAPRAQATQGRVRGGREGLGLN